MAKAKLTLGSAERDIMQIIWSAGAPLTARQILSAIQSRRKWSLSTLMTSLSRLAAKGFVQCDRSTGTNLYTSLMTEEAFRSASAAQGAQNAQRGTAMTRTYDDTMFRDTFEHEYTWLNGFYRNVRRYAKKTAMIDPATSRSWNYNELNHEANRLAHALDADGVGKNDVVMTSLLNCPEFAFSYIAPRKLGAIVNPCNFNLSAGETALLIDHNRPKVFIYSADIAPMATQAVELAKFKPTSVVMADNLKGAALPEGHIAYEDYVRDQLITDPEMKVRPHIYDEVLRLCTSGTTALPKSVPVNDINEVLSAHDIIMHYPMNAYDVLLNMTPWFHRGGVHVGGPCPTFYVGASTIISRVFQPKLSLQTIEEYGVTFAMGAPSSMEMLCRAQEKNPVDLSRLKGLVTMGAPFEKAACERYMKVLTPNIYNGYGTTETLWNSFLRPYDLPEHAGTAGRSCIDDEVRVVKAYDDHKAEPDEMVAHDSKETGEIIIFCPEKTTYSYYNNPAEQEKKFYKGWMYTGDLGTWDEDWFVTICGRKDDMIICSGENIYPTQIEEVLNGHPGVADSLVTAVPDKVRGQVVVAYIVPRDDALTIRELVDFCNETPMLSAYKRPRYYRIVDSLPHTATGKKLHYVMKQQALEDLDKGLLKRS